MGCAARFHDDGPSSELLEERDQFTPSQLALDLQLSALIHAVDLEYGFGGVQASHGNAHRGRFPFYRLSRPVLWHIDAAGAVHPIFKTLEYKPRLPKRFGCIEDAQTFCRSFLDWYNQDPTIP
jgi:hypothetical protein